MASAWGLSSFTAPLANLGLADGPRWSIAFPQVGLGGAFLGPTFADVPDLINLDDLEQGRRDEILASIPESGTEIRVDGRAPVFALQNGRLRGAGTGNI